MKNGIRSQLPIEAIGDIAYEGPNEPDRGFTVRATYLKGDYAQNALIEVLREGNLVREFMFPAYKIWNIAAHFSEIVDSELAGDDHGYQQAAWTGF